MGRVSVHDLRHPGDFSPVLPFVRPTPFSTAFYLSAIFPHAVACRGAFSTTLVSCGLVSRALVRSCLGGRDSGRT